MGFSELLLRPAEQPSKARDVLGWTPRTSCRELAELMVEHDLELARNEATASSFSGP